MTTIESAATTIRVPGVEFEVDEAQLVAVSFLARYSGRTLEAYRHDLRGFFQWATDHGIAVMEASRAHIELFRAWMEDRGLAASTIDRRVPTVCGFYRFAHIDGRIRSNTARAKVGANVTWPYATDGLRRFDAGPASTGRQRPLRTPIAAPISPAGGVPVRRKAMCRAGRQPFTLSVRSSSLATMAVRHLGDGSTRVWHARYGTPSAPSESRLCLSGT
jgi:hypothetical protein